MLPNITVYKIIRKFFPDAFSSFSSNYETRLEVQKLLYLFGQIYGQNIYNHTWYYAGPYSPVLSRQIYNDILPNIDNESAKWETGVFTETANNLMETLEDLMKRANEIIPSFSPPTLYEAVASIWYIANNSTSIDANSSVDNVLTKLMAEKPHLDVENIKELVEFVLERREAIRKSDEES